MKKIWNYLGNGERYQTIAVCLIVLIILTLLSCQSTVRSISDPSKKVTYQGLQNEIDFFMAQAKVKFADLERQEQFKQALFDNALIISQTGVINPIGILTTFGAIIGTGATIDNIRKRKKIKTLAS